MVYSASLETFPLSNTFHPEREISVKVIHLFLTLYIRLTHLCLMHQNGRLKVVNKVVIKPLYFLLGSILSNGQVGEALGFK